MIQTLFGSTEEKPSFLERMKEAVTRTRESLNERIDDLVSIGKEIDRNTLDDLEATLISADLGTATTAAVLEALRSKVDRKQIGNVEELKRVLKEELLKILNVADQRPVRTVDGEPEVILVVGVNGTGKTTSTGKLAYALRAQGKTVLLARPQLSNWRFGETEPAWKSSRTSRAAIPRRCCLTHYKLPRHVIRTS